MKNSVFWAVITIAVMLFVAFIFISSSYYEDKGIPPDYYEKRRSKLPEGITVYDIIYTDGDSINYHFKKGTVDEIKMHYRENNFILTHKESNTITYIPFHSVKKFVVRIY